jgi:hypothetical protein
MMALTREPSATGVADRRGCRRVGDWLTMRWQMLRSCRFPEADAVFWILLATSMNTVPALLIWHDEGVHRATIAAPAHRKRGRRRADVAEQVFLLGNHITMF